MTKKKEMRNKRDQLKKEDEARAEDEAENKKIKKRVFKMKVYLGSIPCAWVANCSIKTRQNRQKTKITS